jgi:ATP-binding cassette, subfamily C, bacterial CydC
MRALVWAVRPAAGERKRLALAVVLAAGATGAAIALLSTSGYLISRAAQRPQIVALTVAIIAVRAFGISRAVLRYAERLASHDLALRQLARLRTRFYRRLAPLVPGGLSGTGRGELLSRFVGDVDTLQDAHLRVVIPLLVAVLVILGASLAGALMLGIAGAVLLVALTVAAVCSTWLSASVAATSSRSQAPARARLTDELVEAIDGSAELALAGRTEDQVRRLRGTSDDLAALARRDALAGALAGGVHSLLTGAGLLAVLVVGIAAVHSGALPGVLLAAVAFLFMGACESIAPLPLAARRLQVCNASALRLQEISEREAPVLDPADPLPVPAAGYLEATDVSMRYGAGEELVLDHLGFRLAPGERVALIGPSGEGKTTLAELLVRFLDPVGGRVTLGGVDVRHLAGDELRRVVLLCAQDAHLFNTTIRENLMIARREISDEELWHVLETVELGDFVADLPDGLDTRVGQQGELVSGGQRQRLALARALLSEARFLILDEPAAHLDAPLARRVIPRVLELAGPRGVLLITHTTDSLEDFDRVIRLDRGRLSEAPQ